MKMTSHALDPFAFPPKLSRSPLGRLTQDKIPSGDLGSGVSNQTLGLTYSFNDAGLPFQQTSYPDSALTTPTSQVVNPKKG